MELIESSPGLTRVDAVARELGVGVRSLQRLFAEHVGVGPKWVVRRYRLREATDRLAAGGRIAWAELAAELGYADQGHLTRDFTEVFGEPPTTYARRY
ncbi:helix-turn-helix domain-containing protein [Actinosynnema pretiosum]|uniref:helix-turn-helix domain-containing protein n=1 Tax=Actinosynnema pretiosum TaxID=42197 RepID=UPI000A5F59C9|nr:helix-turn-helix domain-containing protein [Actinosynnema pretiosum]